MEMARPNVREPPALVLTENSGLEEYRRLQRYANLPDTKVYEFLPTYESATTRKRWDLIAPHITDANDLIAACLVSKEFRKAYMPHLWGSPARHFGENVGARYRVLRRFFQCAELSHIETRLFVHTLDLIKVENYHRCLSFHNYWLPILFHLLPNLQVLQVTRPRPLMERSVLAAIWHANQSLTALIPIQWNPRFGLRMLTLKDVKNIKPEALGEALKFFPNLLYLDLTDTGAAGNEGVIRVISRQRRFPDLQVLKLRNVGLKNVHLFSILLGLSPRLWSLDVRDNCLTDDHLLGAVLAHCFVLPAFGPPSYQSLWAEDYEVTWTTDSLLEMLPLNDRAKCSHTDHRIKNILRVDTESYLRRVLGQVPTINIGPEVENGLTHLYIANNRFSITSIRKFISTGRLRVFDAGTILPCNLGRIEIYKNLGANFWAAETFTFFDRFNEVSLGSLCALRMNHHMVTGDAELFDDGIIPGADTYLIGYPAWAPDSLDETQSIHAIIIQDMITSLVGIRTLLLTDIPRRSHRGWMTQILIELIDVLGKTPNSIEVLYLEITADDPTTAPPPKRNDGPSYRKLPSGKRARVESLNPYIGNTEAILKDYKSSRSKWAGELRFIHPVEQSWGPSSRRRARKAVTVVASRQETKGPVREEEEEVLVLSPRSRKTKRARWFHIPWGRQGQEREASEAVDEARSDGVGDVVRREFGWERAGFEVFEDESAGC